MSPIILAIGLLVFLTCFGIHVVWWRYWHPKNDIFALIITFFIIPVIFYTFLYILRMTFLNLISIILMHTTLSIAYIISYPAVQALCPTLNILLVVNHAMPDGITKEEIKKILGENILVDISIDQMLKEGLTKEIDNYLTPTKLGNLIASFFIIFRSLLGVELGKG